MKANTEYPVFDLIAKRWSPYSFDERSVSDEDLRSLFEAARWAPSSFNEQPWSYILARRGNAEPFRQLLACLTETNQVWARRASVLALGIVRLKFSRNDRVNRTALHDLGLATSNLLLEATARDLFVHQMAGILPDKARELYEIPEGYEAVTGIAIGYAGDPKAMPEEIGKKDLTRRPRKSLREFVFSGKWGSVSEVVS